MLTVHPEFIVDKKARKKAVLLSLVQWRRVQEALEELDDIRAYDKVKSRREPAFPFEDAVRRIKGRRRK